MKKTFIHHNDRSVIAIHGEDVHKFLQGIISNDIGKVSEGNSIYAFVLTPQGKYLFDIFISKNGGKYYLEVFSSLKDELLKKLKMYKLRSKVEITDEPGLAVYSVFGDEVVGYIDPRNKKMGHRAILSSPPEGVEVGLEEYTKLRVENNIPEGEYDLERDKSYPLQYRMIELNAVDFKKGCYVGQEVTARTQHRGTIRKSVYRIEAERNVEPGEDIQLGGNAIGKTLSTYKNTALALLDVEIAANPENNLMVENAAIKVFA